MIHWLFLRLYFFSYLRHYFGGTLPHVVLNHVCWRYNLFVLIDLIALFLNLFDIFDNELLLALNDSIGLLILYLHQVCHDNCKQQLKHIVVPDNHYRTKVTLCEGSRVIIRYLINDWRKIALTLFIRFVHLSAVIVWKTASRAWPKLLNELIP